MAIRHWHLDSGAIRINNFPENEIQIAIPLKLLSDPKSIAIDSTGIKYTGVVFKLYSELLKHAKQAILFTGANAPSATDAVVRVEVYDGSNVLVYTEYAGDSGEKESTVDEATVKSWAGKSIWLRINVTTASATAGATQSITSAVLYIILGIS